MTGCPYGVAAKGPLVRVEGRVGLRSPTTPILPFVLTTVVGGRSPIAWMVVGCLGLVAILSTAPYWHLAEAPYRDQVIACTDFGGRH